MAENGCANLFRNPTKLRQSDSSHGDTSSDAAEHTSDIDLVDDKAVSNNESFIAKYGKVIIDHSVNLLSILKTIQANCNIKGFNAFEIPFLETSAPQKTAREHEYTEHKVRLNRNLSAFSLTSDNVEKDGDCAFRSFLLQLKKVMTTLNPKKRARLDEKLKNIGLFKETEEEDILHLRSVFVNTVLTNTSCMEFLPVKERQKHRRILQHGCVCIDCWRSGYQSAK